MLGIYQDLVTAPNGKAFHWLIFGMSEIVKCYRKHQAQSKKQHLYVIHAGSRSATIYSYEFLKSNGLTTLDNISGMNPMHLFIYFHG